MGLLDKSSVSGAAGLPAAVVVGAVVIKPVTASAACRAQSHFCFTLQEDPSSNIHFKEVQWKVATETRLFICCCLIYLCEDFALAQSCFVLFCHYFLGGGGQPAQQIWIELPKMP